MLNPNLVSMTRRVQTFGASIGPVLVLSSIEVIVVVGSLGADSRVGGDPCGLGSTAVGSNSYVNLESFPAA